MEVFLYLTIQSNVTNQLEELEMSLTVFPISDH